MGSEAFPLDLRMGAMRRAAFSPRLKSIWHVRLRHSSPGTRLYASAQIAADGPDILRILTVLQPQNEENADIVKFCNLICGIAN